MHEWIPTDQLRNVVAHAMSLAQADEPAIEEALAWIHTFNAARSQTALVVFTLHPELRAHEGALSADPTKYQPTGTVGSAAFHDVLRDIFDRLKGDGPLTMLAVLRQHLPFLVSDGNVTGVHPDVLAQKLPVFYRRVEGGVDPNMTLGELAALQSKNFVAIRDKINEVIIEVRDQLR